jgi:hypothetical protein
MDAEAAALCVATLRSGRALTIVNLSPSLSPSVRVGDALTIDPAEPLRPGALVAVERHGRVVVHRLVSRDAAHVVLRGDANPRCDDPDALGSVLGVVTRQRTRMGRVVDPRSPLRRLLGRWLPVARGLLVRVAPR